MSKYENVKYQNEKVYIHDPLKIYYFQDHKNIEFLLLEKNMEYLLEKIFIRENLWANRQMENFLTFSLKCIIAIETIIERNDF